MHQNVFRSCGFLDFVQRLELFLTINTFSFRVNKLPSDFPSRPTLFFREKMASAKRSIDEADFEQPSCSKKARFDGERQSSASLLFSHQNAEIYNLNTPATLLNRSSQVLASHFNDNNECIPQEWFDWIQALVCVYLKPSLFLHFVVRGGGIVALRNNFSNIESESHKKSSLQH